MAVLSLSQANLLLLPRSSSSNGHLPNVSQESRRTSVDVFLKAAGYLDCAVKHVLPQLPVELRRNLPVDLAEGVLRALCLQALGQVSQPTLWREGEARLRGASSKKGKCAKLPPTFIRGKRRKNGKDMVYEL
ncbi:hypothetical protein D0Y65_053203 [Glycine soja]|uniref:Uncharacterized protein n=1 Tax=Glycine soja TaxID=3848 RepID=A0A445F173_GLYSO|nr:hypothetical protein D0Y65_053203 [Glycine soja]